MRTAVLLFALTLGLASLPVTAIDVVAAPQTASPQAAAQPPVQADVDVDMDAAAPPGTRARCGSRLASSPSFCWS